MCEGFYFLKKHSIADRSTAQSLMFL